MAVLLRWHYDSINTASAYDLRSIPDKYKEIRDGYYDWSYDQGGKK